MRTKKEIQAMIDDIERSNVHILTGTMATVYINASRALLQVKAETLLQALYWAINKKFKSKLVGID